MTLEELDNALRQMFLDLESESGQRIRDMVLYRYGQNMIDAKEWQCANCWRKEHGKCSSQCHLHGMSSDPIKASKEYLSHTNDVKLFPFVCMYVIPVYEETTGEKDTMEKLMVEFKRKWAAEGKESPMSSERLMGIK
jgi:hypothetical protein